jgi:hypothetical protein
LDAEMGGDAIGHRPFCVQRYYAGEKLLPAFIVLNGKLSYLPLM